MDQKREKLEQEIAREIENLANLEPGTEEHAQAVESLRKLYQLCTDEDRMKNDFTLKHDEDIYDQFIRNQQLNADILKNEQEIEVKKAEMKHNKKEWIFKYGLQAFGIVTGLAFEVWLCNRGFEFEKDGAVSSFFAKRIFNKKH